MQKRIGIWIDNKKALIVTLGKPEGKPIIREIQSTGVASHRGIARSLNARGVATARGGAWTAVQVGSILRWRINRSLREQIEAAFAVQTTEWSF